MGGVKTPLFETERKDTIMEGLGLKEAVEKFNSMSDEELLNYVNSERISKRLSSHVKENPRSHKIQIIAVMRSEHETDEEYDEYQKRLREWFQ